MCGIHLAIWPASSSPRPLDSVLRRRLCSRGPDHVGNVETRFADALLSFTSTVLSLRGNAVTIQPFEDPLSGSVLCWNGEAWKMDGRGVQGNDGAELFALLNRPDTDILDTIRSIEGPFALVFFDKPSAKLFYARDRLGRRSLLARRDGDNDSLCLSSVAERLDPNWVEVEADGIYMLELSTLSPGSVPAPVRHPWVATPDLSQEMAGIGMFNTQILRPASDSQPPAWPEAAAISALRDHLTESLRLRILGVPEPPSSGQDIDTRVAVLFSGGLDCTVLARLCHDLLPATQGIDLVNVAFENPRIASQADKCHPQDDLYEACPDRVTGRKSFAELLRVCPERAWRFIAINVPFAETTAHRPEVVSLIYPHNTEMDLSIAYALYFAARGKGKCYTAAEARLPNRDHYATPARILLSGLGADELFGGYVRHATAYSRRGYEGLVEELMLDVGRLGKRNLGRDDRIMSNWGREVRFPFLDERLVRWAVELPVWQKCDFGTAENSSPGDGSDIEPAKRVLRLLALTLGMPGVAGEKKRAIQFGSRTAKMESGKVKGTTLIS
ncbi:hypothetical protein GGTG_05399 [Gaeumannomyces tritici R3-111a-1]|uniref:Glutamine amidotransferase type-2 domain-containing protein n=1 Tax=Gaeumannomyces tritici (strain R3-111a-1) TaxID=644352 RepID=J3NVT7_GAET3|nr:hypothetical protein GGTG_05399 [Gaeumannomyces tritici R3-111a-1]EJT75466.1 hypothetical protein GGTG_05399 [Gaeumannomyces tritici R3-111a-1]